MAESLHVVNGLPAERAPHRVLVDVIKARTRVILQQGVFELGKVGQLSESGGGVAQAERAPAGHRLP